MKFKAGQRVKVNVEGVNVGTVVNSVDINCEMKLLNGVASKIEHFYNGHAVKLKGISYTWSPEWLVLADGEQPDGQWGYKGKLYDVVDREAEEGELMLVINPTVDDFVLRDNYGLHDVLTCIEVDSNGNRRYRHKIGAYLYGKEYKVLVPVKEEEPTQDVPNEAKHELATASNVLQAAQKHMIDRAATYDSPEGERSMSAAVQAFNAVYGTTLSEAQGWMFMAILKVASTAQREAYYAGSFEDAAAYMGLAAEAKAKE
ncbi:hypothetical protein [Paenibacillus apiarius]|uniref:hypothetical protein n=1 Tax=Paenibacillus apiarius TaxID=46240 RepID=UPI003B3A1809